MNLRWTLALVMSSAGPPSLSVICWVSAANAWSLGQRRKLPLRARSKVRMNSYGDFTLDILWAKSKAVLVLA